MAVSDLKMKGACVCMCMRAIYYWMTGKNHHRSNGNLIEGRFCGCANRKKMKTIVCQINKYKLIKNGLKMFRWNRIKLRRIMNLMAALLLSKRKFK